MTEPPASGAAPAPRPTVALKVILIVAGFVLIVAAPLAVLASFNVEALGPMPLGGIILVFLPLLLLSPFPLTFGLLVVAGNADPQTADGNRAFRRLILIAGILVLTLSTLLVASASTGALSLIAALATSVVIAALTTAGIWVGQIIRRRDAEGAPLLWPPGEDRLAKMANRARWIYWTFGCVTVVTAVVVVLTVAITRDRSLLEPSSLLNLASIPLVVAGGVGSVVNMNLTSEAGALLGSDPQRTRRLSSALRTMSVSGLSTDERATVRRYAGVAASLIPLQVSQFLFLMSGLATLRLASLLSPNDDLRAINIGSIAFAIIASAVLVPWIVRRGHRQRNFSLETDDPATKPMPSPGPKYP